MASSQEADLVAQFEKFCVLKNSNKNKTQFSPKACEKLVIDCFEEHYKFKGVILKNRVDSSVFSVFKQKGAQYMLVNKGNCDAFLKKAAHEFAKLKKGKDILVDAPEVDEIYHDLKSKVLSTDPKVPKSKQSATGNVGGLTDAKGYTGAHKERFDTKTGKGKGIDGRVEQVDGSGYVGNYKGSGSYAKK